MKLKRIFQYEARSPGEARVNKYEGGSGRPPRRKRKRDELREELGLDNTYDRRRRKPILLLSNKLFPSPFSDEGTATKLELHVSLNNEQIQSHFSIDQRVGLDDSSRQMYPNGILKSWATEEEFLLVAASIDSVVLVPPKKRAKSQVKQKSKESFLLTKKVPLLAGWLVS